MAATSSNLPADSNTGDTRPLGNIETDTRPHPSDWLNPILVKEARQATSGPAFATIMLLLVASLFVWTMLSAYRMHALELARDSSNYLLLGYGVVLVTVMTLIVPWIAFQSMMSEFSANTLPLLSMSAITPRQIVAGKLTSVMAVTATFYSVIAPCIAFAYLIGTLSIVQVLSFLATVLLASWLLSSGAIFLAAAKQESPAVGLLGVAELGACFLAAIYLCLWLAYQCWEGSEAWRWTHVEHPGIVVSLAMVAIAMSSVLNGAAAAALTFRAGNRSSSIRWRLLAFSAAWTICVIAVTTPIPFDNEVIVTLSIMFFLVWFVIGTLLVAERGEVSLRARRALPRSRWSRLFVGWLIPGNATGYFFAVAVAWAHGVTISLVLRPGPARDALVLWTCAGYYTVYLGIVRLLLVYVRREHGRAGFGVSVLLATLLILVSHAIPLTLAVTMGVSPLETLSTGGFLAWGVTMAALADTSTSMSTAESASFILLAALPALAVILLQLPAAAREIFVPAAVVPQAVEKAVEDSRRASRSIRDPFAD